MQSKSHTNLLALFHVSMMSVQLNGIAAAYYHSKSQNMQKKHNSGGDDGTHNNYTRLEERHTDIFHTLCVASIWICLVL